MEMTHTAGPWEVYQLADDAQAYGEDAGKWIVTAKNHQTEVCSIIDRLEDARLIAAAPDLLAACKLAKKLLEPELTEEPDRTIFWRLVAAIAKAEQLLGKST
jgi:hypothetical protein